MTSGKHHTRSAQWPRTTPSSRWEAGCTRGPLEQQGNGQPQPALPGCCLHARLPTDRLPLEGSCLLAASPAVSETPGPHRPLGFQPRPHPPCPTPPPPQLHIGTRSSELPALDMAGGDAVPWEPGDPLCPQEGPGLTPSCLPACHCPSAAHTPGERNVPQEGPLWTPF